MKWTEIPGLSQEHMEQWARWVANPANPVQAHGVIPRMQPAFVSCNFEEGWLDMAYPVLEWELNPQRILHGGVLSTALDTSLGVLCHYYVYPKAVTTVTMNVTFLKPILPGDTFHIRARLDSLGRTLATSSGDVILERDNIHAATCSATYKILHNNVRHFKG